MKTKILKYQGEMKLTSIFRGVELNRQELEELYKRKRYGRVLILCGKRYVKNSIGEYRLEEKS